MIRSFGQAEFLYLLAAARWTVLLSLVGFVGGSLLGLMLAFVGNVLLGVAVWRSGTLPKWAGAIWVASIPTFYLLGALLGIVTTGGSLLTQPVGALLMAIGGGWMALSAMRRPSTAEAVSVRAQPSVQ